MNTQVKETARQILGQVSDIQAELSVSGSDELNLKLAAIREKAAFLFEGETGPEKIIAGYEQDADQAMNMLGEKIKIFFIRLDSGSWDLDADRLQIQRLAELCVQRNRVYFERKARHETVVGKDTKVRRDTDGN